MSGGDTVDPLYLKFENAFRGSEEETKKDQVKYLSYFQGACRVLDLGCGRGEFLEHMRETGATGAYGIDCNDGMLGRGREKGMDVLKSDALSHLRALEEGDLDGIFASHLVEHLAPRDFLSLVTEASRTLKKGGYFVAETLNPGCLFALGPYFMDLTHTFPVHPLTFRFLMEEAGFDGIEFHYRQYLPEDFLSLNRVPAGPGPLTPLEEAYNASMFKLQTIINAAFVNFIYGIAGKKS